MSKFVKDIMEETQYMAITQEELLELARVRILEEVKSLIKFKDKYQFYISFKDWEKLKNEK